MSSVQWFISKEMIIYVTHVLSIQGRYSATSCCYEETEIQLKQKTKCSTETVWNFCRFRIYKKVTNLKFEIYIYPHPTFYKNSLLMMSNLIFYFTKLFFFRNLGEICKPWLKSYITCEERSKNAC